MSEWREAGVQAGGGVESRGRVQSIMEMRGGREGGAGWLGGTG